MGGNAIRRDLGADRIGEVSQLCESIALIAASRGCASIRHAVCTGHGAGAGRQVRRDVGKRFTLDYTERGQAVRRLLDEGFKKQIIPHPVQVDFVEPK